MNFGSNLILDFKLACYSVTSICSFENVTLHISECSGRQNRVMNLLTAVGVSSSKIDRFL
jgi:hypothetical protein